MQFYKKLFLHLGMKTFCYIYNVDIKSLHLCLLNTHKLNSSLLLEEKQQRQHTATVPVHQQTAKDTFSSLNN